MEDLPADFDPNPPAPDLTESTTFKLKRMMEKAISPTLLNAFIISGTLFFCIAGILLLAAQNPDSSEIKDAFYVLTVIVARELLPVIVAKTKTSNPEPVE